LTLLLPPFAYIPLTASITPLCKAGKTVKTEKSGKTETPGKTVKTEKTGENRVIHSYSWSFHVNILQQFCKLIFLFLLKFLIFLIFSLSSIYPLQFHIYPVLFVQEKLNEKHSHHPSYISYSRPCIFCF